jgi:SOS-response transcriptional repressor LexA
MYGSIMSIKERIGARIKAARNEAGLTIKELSEKSGNLKPARIGNWETGLRTPGPSEATHLSELLGVSAAYLLCLTDKKEALKQEKQYITLVPVLSDDELENFASIKTFDALDCRRLPVDFEIGQTLSDRAFGYRIVDNSMSPLFESGDLLTLDPDATPKPGQFILTLVDGALLIRKIRDKGAEGIELLPINDDWPPVTLKSLASQPLVATVIEHRRQWR